MVYGFGVDLGGTGIKFACFDETGDLREIWERPTPLEQNGQRILPEIAEGILSYCKEKKLDRVLGIGIGVPGAVDATGVVDGCVNLGWGTVNVKKELETLTGFPVAVGNDASVAALGECWFGGGKGHKNMVMITLGTGVGGGVVVDGKLLWGAHGAAGEIGHMVLDARETAVCSCGKRGCAEQYCSATGVVRLAKKHLAATAFPSELKGRKAFTCKDVFDAAARGDIPAIEVLERFYDYLGQLIANVCCVINPEIVVLGGGVSKAGQPLLDGAKEYFQTHCFYPCRNTEFALATLGNDAGVYGAYQLLKESVSAK